MKFIIYASEIVDFLANTKERALHTPVFILIASKLRVHECIYRYTRRAVLMSLSSTVRVDTLVAIRTHVY